MSHHLCFSLKKIERAYLYYEDNQGDWILSETIQAPNPGDFGFSVAVGYGSLAIGAPNRNFVTGSSYFSFIVEGKSRSPSASPTVLPTFSPTLTPTFSPSLSPTASATDPTLSPTVSPVRLIQCCLFL